MTTPDTRALDLAALRNHDRTCAGGPDCEGPVFEDWEHAKAQQIITAARAWRANLGDSPETWLTGDALALARAVDTLEQP